MKTTFAFLLAMAAVCAAWAKQAPAPAVAAEPAVAVATATVATVWTSTPVAPIRPAVRLGWSETYAL